MADLGTMSPPAIQKLVYEAYTAVSDDFGEPDRGVTSTCATRALVPEKKLNGISILRKKEPL